jgi:ribosome biogenesis GTPase
MLSSGVMIIDTPGMRELGMWDVSTGLGEAFTDVESYLGSCRFSDCKHQTEPGCAIIKAIEDGELPGALGKLFVIEERGQVYPGQGSSSS